MRSQPKPLLVALGSVVILGAGLFIGARTNTWLASFIAGIALVAVAERPLWPTQRSHLLRDLSWGLAVGIVCALASWTLAPWLMGRVDWFARELTAMYRLLAHAPGPIVAFPVLVLVVVAEELLFRDTILRAAQSRFGTTRAVAVCWISYVLPQLATGTVTMPLVALALGGVWMAQRLWHGSIVAPLTTHLTWNILVLVAFPIVHV